MIALYYLMLNHCLIAENREHQMKLVKIRYKLNKHKFYPHNGYLSSGVTCQGMIRTFSVKGEIELSHTRVIHYFD